MASIKWKTGVTGDWNQAGNWLPGNVPGASDAVTIAAAGNYDVVVDDSESAASVAIGSAGATLVVEGGPGVVFSLGGNMSVAAGTLALIADDSPDSNYGLIQGGTITIGTAGTLAAQSFLQDPNGSVFEVNAAVNLAGTTTIDSDTEITLYAGGTLGGTISGSGTLDLATPVFSASAAATYTSTIAVLSTIGEFDVSGSTLILGKNSSGSISGSVYAGGQGSLVLLGSNTLTLAGGLHLNYAGELLAGSGDKIAISSPVELDNSGEIFIAPTASVTVSNSFIFGAGSLLDAQYNSAVYGGGTFTTTANSVVLDPGGGQNEGDFGEGITWANAGFFEAYGNLALNIVASDTVKIINQAGATIDLQGVDGNIIDRNTNGTDMLSNAGTLGRDTDTQGSSDTGTSTLAANVNTTGLINVTAGTLAFTDGGTIGGTLSGAGTLLLSNGAFAIGNLAGSGHLAYGSGAQITYTGNSNIRPNTTLNGNTTLTIAAGTTQTYSGALTIGDASGGVTLNGGGTLSTTGATTFTDEGGSFDLNITASSTYSNAGVVTDSGAITFNAADGDSGTIINAAAGTFNLASDDANISPAGGTNVGSDIFRNAGTLAKTAGTGTSTIGVALANTGTIAVNTGTIALAASGALGGTVNGAGVLSLGAAFTTAGIAGSGHILIAGTSLTETKTGAITSGLTVTGAGTLAIASAVVLTKSGNLTFGDGSSFGSLTGPGTLATTGTTAIADGGVNGLEEVVNGGLTWNNSGTINDAGLIYFGNTGGGVSTGGATLANTGTLNLTTDDASVQNDDGNVVTKITNAGLLEKTGGVGTSLISAAVSSTGSIVVAAGTLALTGGGGMSGALNGPGLLDLGGGSFTTGGISGAGNLAVTAGATLTATATATVTAKTLVSTAGVLAAAKAITLTETGSLTLGDGSSFGYLSGPGTLTTAGFTAIADGGVNGLEAIANGGLTWNNSGTINDAGLVYFGNTGSGVSTGGATLANTGTLNLTTDDASLQSDDGNVVNRITSSGLLEKTGGTGTSVISVATTTTSTGSVAVTAGTLALTAGGGVSGALNGGGLLDLGGGSFTTTGISGAGNLAITAGAMLTDTATATITARTLVSTNGVLAAAQAVTLIETGNLTLGDGSSFGYLSGPGTLVTPGSNIVSNGGVNGLEAVVNGGLTWNNSGTITDAGLVYFGYTGSGVSTGGATLANTGTLALISDTASLQNNDTAVLSRITSSGLLEKTGGTGTSLVSVATTSTGTVSVTTGTLALTAGGGISGALNGAGLLDLGGGSFTTTGISGAGNLAITAAAILTGTATATITAKTLVSANGVLAAAKAITITETGSLTLGDGSSYGYLSGAGTLVTTGTSAIADGGLNGLEAVINGGLTWNNSGTINDAGLVYFGYTGNGVSTGGATLANTGTVNLTTDDADLQNNDTGVASSITSSGLLEKTGGTATSTIGVATTSTGSVAVTTGTLALTAGGGVSGALNGAGLLDLGGGSFTTTGISGTGNLAITAGAILTDTATATITAKTLVSTNGALAVAKAITLTETGSLTLGDGASFGYLSGPGTIVTTGTTTIGNGGSGGLEGVLNGGLTWNNSGTINDGGLLYFGYTGNGVSTGGATLVNTGTLALTTNNASLQINDGSAAVSLTNAGLLEKTGAATTSTIGIAITNTGTIEAASGTLQLQQAITGTGLLKIDAGATLETSLAIPVKQSVAFNGGAGATLKLDVPQSIGTLTGFTAGDRFDLVGVSVSSAKITGTTLTVVTSGGTYSYVSAGIAGEVVTTATDNAGGTYVSLYRGAIPTHTPEPLAFGNFHVGSTTGTLAHLTVTNSAPADGYSEKLNASFGGASAGFTAAGAVSLLAPGTSNATALTATISTATAGAKTGTATLTLNSNGTGVDGRGLTALPSQTVHLTGGVYNYAAASLATTTINLGQQHVGLSQSGFLTLSNTAATGGFSESLDAKFTASSGGATGTGSVTGIAAGASNSTSLSVGLAGTASGTLSGSETLTYISDGAGTSGLGTTTLGTQAVSITGTFYNLAAAMPGATTIAFGNHHVGDQVAAQTLTITNSAPAGAFSEALDASFASTSASLTGSGSIAGLAAGASASSLTITENDATAGAITGNAVLSLASDGSGIDNLGTTTLLGQTITVTGANYALASGTLASSTVNLGIIHAGTASSGALSLTNAAATGGYSEALDAGLSGASAGLTLAGSITGLLAGQTDASTLKLSVNTAATGAYSGTALLGFKSDGNGIDGLGTTTLLGQTVTVTATVDNYAVATLEDPSGPALTGTSTNETLNLGSVLQNGGALTASFGALNAATGTADLLGGTFASAGAAGFTNSGLGTFSGLSAGQDEHAQSVSLATGTAGVFTETVVLSSYGTNASGYSGALAPETLTIVGTVTASVFHTYTLSSQGPNIIHGADGSGDIFIATAASINSHDALSGGAGTNSVTLSGGGQFDFGALKAGNFTNIPTLNATEGQAAMGSAASTTELLYLSDYVAETVNVAAGMAASGNTNAEAITLYGSSAANIFNLASGADQVFLGTGAETVKLGGAANQVTAGGGMALVRGTGLTATAAVIGITSGHTTLEITTGGAVTLNAADTYLTVQLDAATTLNLSAMSFINVIGSAGVDTINAAATGQTLTGGAGADILTGFAGGGDTFLDTAAGLNGDTIKGWTTNDVIDLTNVSSATLKALTFSNNVLDVSDGHNASFIRFAAGQTLGNFTVLGSDGSGGVLIGYHG